MDFPEPTTPRASMKDVLVEYVDYYRSELVRQISSLPAEDLSVSRLASGWTPLELLKHLTFVERRWLVWGFEGREVADPWGDERDGRWHADEPLEVLLAALSEQAEESRAVVARHALDEVGQPGPRWDGEPPATLERILLHLLQEYARHLGHLDVVVELTRG